MTHATLPVLLVGIAFCVGSAACTETVVFERSDAARGQPPVVTDFLYQAPEDGVRFEARRIDAEGLRFGGFRINLIQDLVLDEVTIRLDVIGSQGVEPSHRVQFSALATGLEVASRLVAFARGAVVLERTNIEIGRGTAWLHHIRADQMRPRDSSLEMIGGVRIETRRGEVLTADRASWRIDDWTLSVPGRFTLAREDRSAVGANGRFALYPDGTLRVSDSIDESD